MRVRLLVDQVGTYHVRRTGEVYDLDREEALALVQRKRAERVDDVPERAIKKHTAPGRRKRKK